MRKRIAAFALVALTIASCATVASDPSSSPSTEPPETTTTTKDRSPGANELKEGLPRSGSYAFLEVTVNGAVIANIEPGSYLRDEWVATDSGFLFLDLRIRNESNSDTANWPPNPFAIKVGDAISDPPLVLQGRPNIGLPALQSTDLVLAFPVSETDSFDNISLIVAQEDRIPMILPLQGEIPDLGFPVPIPLEAGGHILGGCGQDVEIETLAVHSRIDLLETPYPTSYGSRRALLGERFLSVDLKIQNNGGQHCGGGATNFGLDSVRLIVDGDPYAPVAGENRGIAANSVEEMAFHFVYPIAAGEVLLLVGHNPDLQLTIPVDVISDPIPSIEE